MKERLIRELQVDEIQSSEDVNVISFSCASQLPYVKRDKRGRDYAEVLLITEESVDFTRLVDGRAPLLLQHNDEDQIGVVERAWIENEKLYVTVRFSKANHAQEILQDVKDGIRRNVSIGYGILDSYNQEKAGELPVEIVTRFIVYEVSIVSAPADYEVGIGRSLDKEDSTQMEEEDKKENTEEQEEKECSEEEKKAEETAEETKEDTAEEEKSEKEAETTEESKEDEAEEEKNCDEEEIKMLGYLMECRDLADQFIKEKRSYADFKTAVKEYKNNLNIKDKKSMEQKFSLRKALLNATGKMSNEEAAFERSIIDENKRKFNITDGDIVLSRNELRAFDGTEAINQTVYQPGMYTENLRPPVTVDYLGTTKVAVTGPSISFSVCTSGLNAGFVTLNGDVPSATMNFELKTMVPKKEGAFVDVSYTALLQDDPSAEGIIMNDIVKALDAAKDHAFFNGTSGNNQPVGLLNTTGINEITIPSGGPVLSTMLEFEKEIRDSFDYSPNLKWVMAPNAYYQLAATPYSATALNEFLVDPKTRKCLGYDVYVDPNLPTGTIVLGNFNEALEANFDGIVIKIVEDAALARRQAIEIVAHRALDYLFRRPKSFSVGTIE